MDLAIKPSALVLSFKFWNFVLVIHSNCVVPVFQGGDLCVIMEKRTHKAHYLSIFVQISEVYACNSFKLCGEKRSLENPLIAFFIFFWDGLFKKYLFL